MNPPGPQPSRPAQLSVESGPVCDTEGEVSKSIHSFPARRLNRAFVARPALVAWSGPSLTPPLQALCLTLL